MRTPPGPWRGQSVIEEHVRVAASSISNKNHDTAKQDRDSSQIAQCQWRKTTRSGRSVHTSKRANTYRNVFTASHPGTARALAMGHPPHSLCPHLSFDHVWFRALYKC